MYWIPNIHLKIVDWTSITSYYIGWFGNRLIRIARLIFPRSWINSLCIKMINGLFKHPFLVEKTNFADSIQIIYNGVGGVSIKISDKSIKSVLLDADLISVRDLHSNHILESKWGLKNKLTPDIANALSQFYPKNKLLKSTTKKTKAFISKNNNNYFCFQIAQQYENKKLSLIIDSLSKILSKGTSIALLPLGIVSGHEDNRILEKIY